MVPPDELRGPHRIRLCHHFAHRQDGSTAVSDHASVVWYFYHMHGRDPVIRRWAWNNLYSWASNNCRARFGYFRARRAGRPPNSKTGIPRLYCAPESQNEALAGFGVARRGLDSDKLGK